MLLALIDKVKVALGGITTTALNEDIGDDILACKKDLEISGVVNIDDTDPLIIQAVKLFLRARYNYMGEGTRWEEAYLSLKKSLMLCSDYTEPNDAD